MKKLIQLLAAGLLLAGCASAKPTAAPEPSSSGKHGCDAFEECGSTSTTTAEEKGVFKQEYEALNGTANKSGKIHRTITIPEDHPFVLVTPEDIVEKLENKESFWVYFGDPKCPWCRSVLEVAVDKAKEYNVTEILAIDIWDQDGKEILRDKYELQDGKPVKTGEGTEAYQVFLKEFGPVLEDYELEDDNGTRVLVEGEKRIYAPTFIHVVNGTAVKSAQGFSDKQEDPREELTEELLADEKAIFDKLFKE